MMGTMAQTHITAFVRALAALSLSLVLGLARAQDAAPEADPPDRAARLSYLQGDVSMQPAGENAWAPAILNRPLTTGDKLWTEQGGRAEVQVGPAAVRLDSNTGFSFLNVDDDTIQMRMTAGVISVTVRTLDNNDHIEIDTPNAALSLLRPGNYRVEVNDAGDTTVLRIADGEAEATGPSLHTTVHNQQAVTFRGTDQVTAQAATLGAPDEFDTWSLDRDHRDIPVATSRTAEYVSPEVTGYQDLDHNGSWSPEPEYGYVWTPTNVAVGWAPYQYGRWVWVSPWGWTWVDDAPWGYAPFHYGRWAYVRQRWCWVPGPRAVRAVYAPALVGWVGSPGVGVTVAVGHVGWFPLGPREVYVPARRYSPHYVERVNVSNTVIVNRTYITNVYDNHVTHVTYRNRAVPGGVTMVSRDTFTSAGRVGDRRVRVTDTEFRNTTVVNAPRIAPVRESRMGGEARANFRAPPQAVSDRQVVVRRNPPAPARRYAREVSGQVATDRPAEFDRNRTVVSPSRPAAPLRPDRPDRPDRPERSAGVVTSAPKTPPREAMAPEQRNVQTPAAEPRHDDRPPRDDRPQREDRPHQQIQNAFSEERERQQRDQQAREQQRQQQPQANQDPQNRWREQQRSSYEQLRQQQARDQQQRQADAQRQSAAREADQRQREEQRTRVEHQQESRPQQQAPQQQRQEHAREQRDNKRNDSDTRPQN